MPQLKPPGKTFTITSLETCVRAGRIAIMAARRTNHPRRSASNRDMVFPLPALRIETVPS
jgi:hypothetical protein